MGVSLLRTDKEFTALYETHVDMVYRLCFTILKNRFDTEDAVQDTFLKLFRHSKPFQSAEHEKAWLITTASNTCKDALRRASRKEESLADRDFPEACGTDANPVLEAVLDLPLKYRVPVYLYYYEGYSGAEIAAMLHRPASTIRNHLHEARQMLKQQLEGGDVP